MNNLKKHGKCIGCGNNRLLLDGRLCRACLWIERHADPQFEWTEEEADMEAECDGCALTRPLKTITNKNTGKKLDICKQCFQDGFFKSPDAAWRRK